MVCGLPFVVCRPWSVVRVDLDLKAVIARVKVTRVVTASAALFIKCILKHKVSKLAVLIVRKMS